MSDVLLGEIEPRRAMHAIYTAPTKGSLGYSGHLLALHTVTIGLLNGAF